MKKHAFFLLVILAAMLTLSSCDEETEQTSTVSVNKPAEEITETEKYIDDVPEDLRYEGQIVRFLINQQFGLHDLTGDDDGDIVFDAIYKRNLYTEERLNVKIVPEVSEQSATELLDKVRQTILANTDPYHVYLARGPEAAALSLDGDLLSEKELPYINMDAPWWNKNYTQNMSINNNNLEYFIGDMNMSVFMCSNAVFFNKSTFTDRFGDYEEQLYKTVFDGKWTYDVFMNYVEQSYEDLNGNGQVDENDHFGIVYLNYVQDWYISSAGITFMGRDDNGFPTLQLYNDNTVKFCEYLKTLFGTPQYGWCFKGEQLDMGNMFKSRNTLFLPGRFTYVDGNLCDMEDSYGVLPYPKVTEDMDYMAASGHSGNFIAVPGNNLEPEMTSAVLEVMTAESHKTVFPTYYETALKIKYTDGGVDAEMIDLIHDCMTYYVTSFVDINGTRIGTILQDVVMTNNEFTSTYNAQIGQKEELLKELICSVYGKSSAEWLREDCIMKYCNDMSGYMQSGPLLHSAYLMASDSVGVYVHTTKPSVRGVFAFGALGRLHNVLYDLDCANLYSDLYGICPSCGVSGNKLFPYRTGHDVRSSASFNITGEKHLHFDSAENGLVFEHLPLYAEGQLEVECTLPLFAVSVQENRVRIRVKFPEGAEETGLHLPWYPLYDTYTADGVRKSIQYYKHGFYGIFPEGYKTEGHSEILLEDCLSRQAGLRITAEKGSLSLCSRTVPTMGNAMILSTDGTAQDGELDITIAIVPADVTVHGSHYYPCGSEAEVQCTENGVVSVKKFIVPEEPGVHALPLGGGREYLYCAVPEKRKAMKKAADGCLALFWKDGNLTGTPPYAFDPVLLEPRTRSGMRYCSHGMRTMSCLAAEGVHAGDISYVDAAAHAIRQIAAVSHHGEDGSVFTPLLMDDNGDPGIYKWSSRPSDAGIVIRGLVHAAKGYIHFHKKGCAEECVRLARAYARTIEKMQNPDGSFYDRYCYPTLEPAVHNKGTVNNWCLQLWKLLPLLRSFGMDTDADEILALIRRYIRYQTEKENSILYISGGGEDASDFGDALNTDATLFTIQYLLTGEGKWKEYAEQALKKSWLLSCMWADMLQFFGLYGNSDLGDFYDQPHGMFSAGGMHDLTAVEANLFAAEALGSGFGQDMADRLHSARLSSFIRDNGGMYMVMLQCPNYAHRDDRHSETLMYGGVGVYAWAEAERESEPIQQLLAQYTFLPEQEKAEV